MANILIAHSNLVYSKKLLNTLHKLNSDIKVCSITQDGRETLDILNYDSNIDAFILDFELSVYNGCEIIRGITDRYKYVKSCILLINDENIIKIDKKIMNRNIIYKMLPKNTKHEDIIAVLNKLTETTEAHSKHALKLRRKILQEVVGLGYDLSYKGTHFLITAIEFIISNPHKETDILETQLYPYISQYYHTNIHNVKCNINRATTMMFYNCSSEKIENYFCIDPDIKPKIKTVIDTIVNNVS